MAIEKALLDRLLAGRDPNEVFSRDGLLDDLKKALSERILNTELDEHLDDEREADGPANRRNGHSQKTVLTGSSKMTLSIPRDRAGTFDPKLIARYQRRFPEFDDKIISMYARCMSVREIRGHLEELYGIEVSPDLISTVTDAVLEEVAEWQNRPLDAVYPLRRREIAGPSTISFPPPSSTRSGSRSGTKASFATRPSMSHSPFWPTAARKSSGFGSSRPKGRSSGFG